jgi:hypothetical protein
MFREAKLDMLAFASENYTSSVNYIDTFPSAETQTLLSLRTFPLSGESPSRGRQGWVSRMSFTTVVVWFECW